jgi:hypothetical protein
VEFIYCVRLGAVPVSVTRLANRLRAGRSGAFIPVVARDFSLL